jgi:hypothetical protein
MKKTLTSFLLLTLLASCNGGPNEKVGKATIDLPGHSPKEETNTQPITSEDSIETEFISPSSYACVLSKETHATGQIQFRSALNGEPTSFTEDLYHIIFIPEDLSMAIIDDLQDKADESKLTPEMFWLTLDFELSQQLNKLLVNRMIRYQNAYFNQVRHMIAYSLTYMSETNDFSKAIKLKGSKNKIMIMTNPEVTEFVEIEVCDYDGLMDNTIPASFERPEDITTLMTCSNDKDKLTIKGVQKTKLIITIPGQDFNREVFLNEFNMKKSRKWVEYEMENDEIEVELDFRKKKKPGTWRTYLDGTVDYLNLYIKDEFGKYKAKKLRCDITIPMPQL